MNIDDMVSAFKRKISDKAQEIALDVGRGAAGDYASYRDMVGRTKGLREAIEVIDQEYKRLAKEAE